MSLSDSCIILPELLQTTVDLALINSKVDDVYIFLKITAKMTTLNAR